MLTGCCNMDANWRNLVVLVAVGLVLPAAVVNAVVTFDTKSWDVTFKYPLDADGNATDFIQEGTYDRTIDCTDDDWLLDTNTTTPTLDEAEHIRWGLNYTNGEIGYEDQIDGEIRLQVLVCDGDFTTPDIVDVDGGGHEDWDVVEACVLDEPGVKVLSDYDFNVEHPPDKQPPEDPHPAELTPNLNDFPTPGDPLGLGRDEMDTKPLLRDTDVEPVVDVCYQLEFATDTAFLNALPDDKPDNIPFTGTLRASVTNHDGNDVCNTGVQEAEYLGGAPWSLPADLLDCNPFWGQVRCDDNGGNKCIWREDVTITSFREPFFGISTGPAGWVGSQLFEVEG